jgi:GTPase
VMSEVDVLPDMQQELENTGNMENMAEVERPRIPIRIAVIGKPNVGKSTLVNRLLGEERVIVYDEPGTTRDSIFIPFERQGEKYALIDTAGVRRRGKISDTVEKFSVIKSLQAIEVCHVAIMVIDAREGVSDQDLRLLNYAIDAGKAMVIAVNKWDSIDAQQRQRVHDDLEEKLGFVHYVERHCTSALHGKNIECLFSSLLVAHMNATRILTTAQLTRILEQAVENYMPPLRAGKRIKLRFAHPGGINPPVIVVHGNQTRYLSDAYKRYLINFFRQKLQLIGTPIRLQLRTTENPYAGRKNMAGNGLKQHKKRHRLLRFSKRNRHEHDNF